MNYLFSGFSSGAVMSEPVVINCPVCSDKGVAVLDCIRMIEDCYPERVKLASLEAFISTIIGFVTLLMLT